MKKLLSMSSSIGKIDWNKKEKHKYLECWITDFCRYYGIVEKQLYDKVVHKKKEMTVIQKEIQILTQMQFFLFDENSGDFKFVNLFLQGGNTQGKIYLEIHQSLIAEHYLNLKSNYTNIYLPYTKNITSKYSMRLYEYLRSYLYMNSKTKKTPTYEHEWNLEKLSKILEPVKRDLENTDIIFTYELIKVGKKYSQIILNTHLDLEKFNAQNPELEKVPTKKEYKKYVNKSKLIANVFKNKKNKIIEQPILNDEQIQDILDNIDFS